MKSTTPASAHPASLYIACSLVLLLFTSLLVSRSFHLSPPFPLFYTSSSSSSVYLSPIRSFLAQSCFALSPSLFLYLSLPLPLAALGGSTLDFHPVDQVRRLVRHTYE